MFTNKHNWRAPSIHTTHFGMVNIPTMNFEILGMVYGIVLTTKSLRLLGIDQKKWRNKTNYLMGIY